MEKIISSFSREIQSKTSQVQGQVKKKWEDHKREQAHQVRDNDSVMGESTSLVPISEESRVGVHWADAYGQQDKCRSEEGIQVVQTRHTEEYLKVQDGTLDDRGTVESRYEVQQDEPHTTTVKIQTCQEPEDPMGGQVKMISSKSPLVLKMQPQDDLDLSNLLTDEWAGFGYFHAVERMAMLKAWHRGSQGGRWHISPQDRVASEVQVLQAIQRDSLSEILREVQAGKSNPYSKFNVLLYSDGLLRIEQELTSKRHPVILHVSHPATAAIMRELHGPDCGEKDSLKKLLAEFVPRFHATGAAILARDVIAKCEGCRCPVQDDTHQECAVSKNPLEGEDDPMKFKKNSGENFKLKFKMMIPCRGTKPSKSSQQTHKTRLWVEKVRRKKRKWQDFFKERRIKLLFLHPGC